MSDSAHVQGAPVADRGALSPPVTDDPAVDEATAHLAASTAGSLEDRLAAGERLHRVLTARLSDVDEG